MYITRNDDSNPNVEFGFWENEPTLSENGIFRGNEKERYPKISLCLETIKFFFPTLPLPSKGEKFEIGIVVAKRY